MEIIKVYPWDFVQIQLNYYDWYFGDAKELYEILTKAGIPVMVMEPVHGGLLANLTEEAGTKLKTAAPDQSQASWAMRWVMNLDNVQVILSGMDTTFFYSGCLYFLPLLLPQLSSGTGYTASAESIQ